MPILKAQLGWSDTQNLRYSVIISSVAILGMSLGSLMGGLFIEKGRRRGGLIMCVLAIIGGLF